MFVRSNTNVRMPYTITRFENTPNPNALKCILDRAIPAPIRSFRSSAEVGDDVLGQALFRVPGVAGILINGSWMTVNKLPEATWASVKAGVQAALAEAAA